MRCHYKLAAIDFIHAAIHLNNLHKAWPLKTLTLLILLHLSKYRRVLWKVIIKIYKLILMGILIRFGWCCLILQRSTLPALMKITHCRNFAPRFIWWDRIVTMRARLSANWRVLKRPLYLTLRYLLSTSDVCPKLLWLGCCLIIQKSILKRAVQSATIQDILSFYCTRCHPISARRANSTHPTLHSLETLKHALIVVGRGAGNWIVQLMAVSRNGWCTIRVCLIDTLGNHLVMRGVDSLCLELVQLVDLACIVRYQTIWFQALCKRKLINQLRHVWVVHYWGTSWATLLFTISLPPGQVFSLLKKWCAPFYLNCSRSSRDCSFTSHVAGRRTSFGLLLFEDALRSLALRKFNQRFGLSRAFALIVNTIRSDCMNLWR